MFLYMIRHGESTANVERLHAGWAQVPLTQNGRADAYAAKEILKEIHFDKVYSSDLLRAIETVKIALPNTIHILTDLIREINVGELSGKSISQCIDIYGDRYLKDKAARDFSFYGGENGTMQMKRVGKFLDMISGENVAAFCHEGTIRCTLKLANDAEADTRILKNGGVYLFENNDGKWNFKAEKKFKEKNRRKI